MNTQRSSNLGTIFASTTTDTALTAGLEGVSTFMRARLTDCTVCRAGSRIRPVISRDCDMS